MQRKKKGIKSSIKCIDKNTSRKKIRMKQIIYIYKYKPDDYQIMNLKNESFSKFRMKVIRNINNKCLKFKEINLPPKKIYNERTLKYIQNNNIYFQIYSTLNNIILELIECMESNIMKKEFYLDIGIKIDKLNDYYNDKKFTEMLKNYKSVYIKEKIEENQYYLIIIYGNSFNLLLINA